jgi:hypothetical protein
MTPRGTGDPIKCETEIREIHSKGSSDIPMHAASLTSFDWRLLAG